MEMSFTTVCRTALAAAALTLAAPVLAQAPDIRPGLWEMKPQDMKGANMPDMAKMAQAMEQMKAQLAKLPPEQRRMVEQQMGDMGMSLTGSGGIRLCMTREDIQRQEIPMHDERCNHTVREQSAKRWSATMTCTQPTMTGEAVATFENPKAYTVAVKGMVKEGGQQQPYAMTMKWAHVSDDCGSVKPLSKISR